MLDIPSNQAQQAISLNFQGSVTKEEAMTDEGSASDRKQGTWSVLEA
jgi:hypothetical protein